MGKHDQGAGSSLLEGLRHRSIDMLRRVLVAAYIAGVLVTLVGLLFVPSSSGNKGMAALVGVQLFAAVVLALGRDLPVWAIKFFGFSGAVIVISFACAVADPIGPVPLFYLWPAINCGCFGTWRDVRVTAVVMAVSFAAALPFAHGFEVPLVSYGAVVLVFVSVICLMQVFTQSTNRLLDELAHAASSDPLTGLLNRRAFNQALDREVERAKVSRLQLSLAVFDLDHFKRINDGHGHPVGDEALCAFGEILAHGRSVTDVIARLGGEEFAVLLFDCDAREAQRRVARAARDLGMWAANRGLALTTSAGVATLSTGVSSSPALIKAADRALYAAKEAGRNRVLVSGSGEPALLLTAA